MEHDGKALAADENDAHHLRTAGMASVHVRASVTWIAIFPLAALGMSALAGLAPGWHPVLRAFVLTLFVVPTAVYFAVPRLLRLHAHLSHAVMRRQLQRRARRATRVH